MEAPRGRGGFGRGRGDRGRGRRGPRRGGRRDEEKEWVPVTKMGRLVKDGKIRSLEEIFLSARPIKEYQIVDHFLPGLVDRPMKVKPVQKQSSAGQRTRFKAYVAVGDSNCHIGLGVKCSKEVAGAIRGAIISAKLSLVPVRKGYWGARIGEPHTVPCKVEGKAGSVRCMLIPAPRGTGIVAAPKCKQMLQFAGIEDCYTASGGNTRCTGNFVQAAFQAISRTYHVLTPEYWKDMEVPEDPLDANAVYLQHAMRRKY